MERYFLFLSLYSKLAPLMTLDNSSACPAGDAFSDTLQVVFRNSLHCRHHKGGLASVCDLGDTF